MFADQRKFENWIFLWTTRHSISSVAVIPVIVWSTSIQPPIVPFQSQPITTKSNNEK